MILFELRENGRLSVVDEHDIGQTRFLGFRHLEGDPTTSRGAIDGVACHDATDALFFGTTDQHGAVYQSLPTDFEEQGALHIYIRSIGMCAHKIAPCLFHTGMHNGVDLRAVRSALAEECGQYGFDELALRIVDLCSDQIDQRCAHLRIGANDVFRCGIGIENGAAGACDDFANVAFTGSDTAGEGNALRNGC